MLSPGDQARLRAFVSAPSATAVLYQASALTAELKSLSQREFPEQALQVRDVFLSIVDHVQEELAKSVASPTNTDDEVGKILACGFVLRFVYRNLRALRASGTHYCSGGLQAAIQHLAENSFPNPQLKLACLARTQPMYMATFSEPLSELFSKEFDYQLLPPRLKASDLWSYGSAGARRISNSDLDYIIREFWRKWQRKHNMVKSAPPTRIAVVSFAGLDDHDSLLFSIFAHEVAHFFDLGAPPDGNCLKPILQPLDKRLSQIAFDRHLTPGETSELKSRMAVLLRELFADIVAARIMGFPYFIALAELLKTMSDWKQDIMVHKDGYPSMHLRLALVLEQILSSSKSYNITRFLESCASEFAPEADELKFVLDEWEQKLRELNKVKELAELQGNPAWPLPSNPIDRIVQESLASCLHKLNDLVLELFPSDKVPELSKSIFVRVRKLCSKKSPHLKGDTPQAFHDILFAGWVYQIVYGEKAEAGIAEPQAKFEEYERVCKSVSYALDISSQKQ